MSGSIPLGVINFGYIEYSGTQIAEALKNFVKFGSQKGAITIEDLKIVSDQGNAPATFSDVGTALFHGTKLFDALMYFSLPENLRPPVRAANPGETSPVRDGPRLAQAVFYLAFFLLTRAKVPSGPGHQTGPDVPAFLRNILGLNQSPDHYMGLLASFDLGRMRHDWIEHINWSSLGQEAVNRFGLGVAGYRNFTPFKLLEVKDGASDTVKRAVACAKAIVSKPADWAIHPITRDPNILSNMGNLNRNLGNLMLEAFTTSELNELVANRVIYALPVRDPRYQEWKTWSLETMPILDRPIFRAPE